MRHLLMGIICTAGVSVAAPALAQSAETSSIPLATTQAPVLAFEETTAIRDAVSSSSRSISNVMRDAHRNPQATLDETRTVFAKMYAVLKPGGMLGLVEHRARPDVDLEEMIKTGYVSEQLVLELALEAGFELVSRSAVNQNPQDLRDHPHGVWSLPPTFRGGNENRIHLMGVGESDRMTLLFIKPQ